MCRTDVAPICFTAAELADPALTAQVTDIDTLGAVRGSGCKHDGGPLWVSIPIVDDPVVAGNGTGTYPQSLWARFFQRAPGKPLISREQPKITSYNNPERYEYSSRYESVGTDNLGKYQPRLAHSGLYAQIDSRDAELVECLRVLICTSTA